MAKEFKRRDVLGLAGTTALYGTAGCSGTPIGNEVTDSGEEELDGLRILARRAYMSDGGKTLVLEMEGKAEQSIKYAAIRFGHLVKEKTASNDYVSLKWRIENPHEVSGKNEVIYTLRDSAGNEAIQTVTPDGKPPSLSFEAIPTRKQGEIQFNISAEDDNGLAQITVLLNGKGVVNEEVGGKEEYSYNRRIAVGAAGSGRLGVRNELNVEIADWVGNRTESSVESYVRKYDHMKDTRLDIGAVYSGFTWRFMKNGDLVMPYEPEVDDYGNEDSILISPEATSRHIDQMTGFGINRVLFTFNGTHQHRRYARNFLKSDLLDHTTIEPFYTIKPNYTWVDAFSFKDEIVPDHMSYIRDEFLSRDYAAEYDGRPTVTFWNAHVWADHEHVSEQILEEWAGYSEFVDDLRSHLRVDGKDPFLVADSARIGVPGGWAWTEELFTEFDGLTTWIGNLESGETISWEDQHSLIEKNFRGCREFAREHDMEFIPTIFPGFDDRGNTSWGQDRHIPRSQEDYKEILETADKYRTTDRINIATWNDWAEGTQIEPGSFRGADYGTDFVEIIEEFQRS